MQSDFLNLDNISYTLAYQLDVIEKRYNPEQKSICISNGITLLSITNTVAFELAKMIANFALTIINGIGSIFSHKYRDDFKISSKRFAFSLIGVSVAPIWHIYMLIKNLLLNDLNPFICRDCWRTPERPARDVWTSFRHLSISFFYDYVKIFNRPKVDEHKVQEEILQKFNRIDKNHRNMYWVLNGHYLFFDSIHDKFWAIRVSKDRGKPLEIVDISSCGNNFEGGYPNIQISESMKLKFQDHHAEIWV
ncbi:MAG: hypothetical protein KR126chlam3_01677 [Chlamydiae bacterium]|nr:hypothetical protein [Chlamydiota bacterium]